MYHPIDFQVQVADESHIGYIPDILEAIFEASQVKTNSIVMRDPDYLAQKMREGKAVIALTAGQSPRFAGFCYIECWEDARYVANSGLIVKPEFRGQGLASRIKQQIFQVCRTKFPHASIFSITKSQAVLKMNTQLGFKVVPYSELTADEHFWAGCSTCPHYPELLANNRQRCQCIGLLYRP